MLESKFTEDLEQRPSSGATGDKTRKRRQAQTTTPQLPTGMDLVEEDEDDIYPPVAQTKKLKLGVGYAGDVREDVRGINNFSHLHFSLTAIMVIYRLQVNRKL